MQRRVSIGIFSLAAITGAFAAGAVVAYFLDPDSGGRRRARVRDGITHARHAVTHGIVEREHVLLNRGRGLLARAAAFVSPSSADGDIVIERIRSKLGHICSHPHDIEVHSRGDGRFEVSGAVLDHEHAIVLRALARVPGVKGLEDALLARNTDAEVIASRGSSPSSEFARVTGPS